MKKFSNLSDIATLRDKRSGFMNKKSFKLFNSRYPSKYSLKESRMLITYCQENIVITKVLGRQGMQIIE